MTITITPAYDGRLLRSYLKLTLGLSSAALARMKNHEHGILVNGERVTVRHILHTGDIVELYDRDTPETATETVIPCKHPLDILYEDDHVTVLNKPPYMPTHPSHGHLTDTLANALAYRYAAEGEPFVFRPLGRLDRNTSGVVIMGKTRAASGILGRSLQKGLVRKRYLAVLAGELPGNNMAHTLRTYMHRPEATGIRRSVCDADAPGAEVAETVYRILMSCDEFTLVLAEPKTGRTHQLRVHFAHLGHPILGDEIYGVPDERIGRHALHAVSLSFPLPFSDDLTQGTADTPVLLNRPSLDGYLHTWAPVPSDIAAVLSKLTQHVPNGLLARLLSSDAPTADILTYLDLST